MRSRRHRTRAQGTPEIAPIHPNISPLSIENKSLISSQPHPAVQGKAGTEKPGKSRGKSRGEKPGREKPGEKPGQYPQFPITGKARGKTGIKDTVPAFPRFVRPGLSPGLSRFVPGLSRFVPIHAPSTGGPFAFTLRGIAGPASSGLTHAVAATLAVQDFTVTTLTTLTPTPPSGGVGDTVQYQFAIGWLGGLNGTVSVDSSNGWNLLPGANGNGQRCMAEETQPTHYAAGVVTLAFRIDFVCSAPWPYNVPLVFSSGGITHNITVPFFAVTTGIFSLSTLSTTPSVSNQGQVTLPIHVTTSLNGQYVYFPQDEMVVPCGGTVITPPAAVTVSPTAPADTSLTISTTNCAPGTWTASVTGASGSYDVTQPLALPFVVGPAAPPDFGLQPTPSTVTVAPGATGMYTLNVTSINGFSQTVSLAATGLPAGVTATFPAGSTVTGAGTASLRLAAATTAIAGAYNNITITGTATGYAPRTATLTLSIVVPSPTQSGITFGAIPQTTVPGDGTVVSVAVPVTTLNGSTATLRLRSTSHLPKGMNVAFSGLTMLISADNEVSPGEYCVDYEGDDGEGDDEGNEDCGITVGPPGGGGDGDNAKYLMVPSQIGVPNNNQPTGIGPYWVFRPAGLPDVYAIPAGDVTSCSAGAGITAVVQRPSQSDPSNPYDFDIVYTVPPGTSLGGLLVTCQLIGLSPHQTTNVNNSPGLSVYDASKYDATPQITSVTPNVIPAGQDSTVTIAGNSFGAVAGTLRICDWTSWPSAFPIGPGPCIQSGDWTVGSNVWGAVIEAILHEATTASGHYCLQVTSLGANGRPFLPAPNGATLATSVCIPLNAAAVTLTPTDVSGNPGDVFTFTASATAGTGIFTWSITGEDAGVYQFVSSSCTSGQTCSAIVPNSCVRASSCTAYVQAKSPGFANVGIAFQQGSAISQPQSARVRAITVQITKIWSDQFPDGPVANYLPGDGGPGSGAGLVGNARQLLIVGVRDSRNGDAFPLSGWKGYIKGLVTTSPAGAEALDHILVRIAQGVPLTAPTAGSWATAGLNTPPGGVGGVNSSGAFSVAIEQQLAATDYTVVAGVNRNATMNQATDTLTAPQTSTWVYLPCPVTPASHGPCSNGAVRIISLAENIAFEGLALGGAVLSPQLPTAADHLTAFVTGHAPPLALPAPPSPNSDINTAELLFNIGLVLAAGTSPYGGPIYEYQYANMSNHADRIRADSDFQSLIFETVALHKAEVLAHFSGLPAGSNFTFPAWQAIGCSSALKAGYVGPCPAGGNTGFDDTPASTADFPALFPCSAGPGSLPPGVAPQSLAGKECDLTFNTVQNLNYAFGRVGYNFGVIANVTSVDSSHFLLNNVSLVGYLYGHLSVEPCHRRVT